MDYALIFDDDFIEKCANATKYVAAKHLKTALQTIDVKLAPPPAADVSCCQVRISRYFSDLRDPVYLADSISKYFDDLHDPNYPDAAVSSFQATLDSTLFWELILQFIPVNKI